uniref:L1 transposable element RRM domain-containing protein n=1 Tax=Poecilia reticulata TaxID=8081 RepID=A0A3P9MU56_POERE
MFYSCIPREFLGNNNFSVEPHEKDIMPNSTKLLKGKSEASKQTKLFDHNLRGEARKANKNMAAQEEISDSENSKSDQILVALESLKSEFSSKLDDLLVTLQDMKQEMKDYNERMSRAEDRISSAEDEVANLHANKLIDLETRSRLKNLRLVNLPEGAEGSDLCAFLEKWIPKALGREKLQTSLSLERAHRLGPRKDGASRPRALIMKFLNYREKQAVIRVARKKDIFYKEQRVRFYPDLATGLHQLRKMFDSIREVLRNLNIRNAITYPATRLVTYENETLAFKTPEEASEFIKKLRRILGGKKKKKKKSKTSSVLFRHVYFN